MRRPLWVMVFVLAAGCGGSDRMPRGRDGGRSDGGGVDAGARDGGSRDGGGTDGGCVPADEVCDGADQDCDGMIDEGDPAALCALAHATSTCTEGRCDIGACERGFGDCDALPETGCEEELTSSTHCGECGATCARDHAVPDCSMGTCGLGACDPGWGDCDGVAMNGCETALVTTESCGACGTTCAPAGGSGDCSDGTCRVSTCEDGFADCDGDGATCERSIRTPTDCGACDAACSFPHASASCASGACELADCDVGFGDCDGLSSNGCETALDSTTSCGACGAPCAPSGGTGDCAGGTCRIAACDAGLGDCNGSADDGCETSLRTLTDCAGCGVACMRAGALATCDSGSCAIVMCDPGRGSCDGVDDNGCEAPLTTLTHCSACGVACSRAHATADCGSGTCRIGTCDAGYGDCDGIDDNGCETPLNTATDCGTCGRGCAPAAATGDCSTGTCLVTACDAGFDDCNGAAMDGCETALTTVTDCGACGVPCSPAGGTGDCSTGSCRVSSCGPGLGDCDMASGNGCETSLRTLTDCGGCGLPCARAHATATCSSGTCAIQSCDAGYDDCDAIASNGCEQSLDTLAHCGACRALCNYAHASELCSMRSCMLVACDPGWGNCNGGLGDGCEQTLTTTSHCGTCGNTCTNPHGTTACTSGACNPTCAFGYQSCDGDLENGCEGPNRNTNPACALGTDLGDVSGDVGSVARSTTGYAEARYFVDITEDNSSCIYTSAQVVLRSPAGVDFDLAVTCSGCGGTTRTVTAGGAGAVDSLVVWHGDSCFGEDSGFRLLIEVRYASGARTSCGSYTLQVVGNIAATSADLCCGDC